MQNYTGCKVRMDHAKDDNGKRWCLPGVRRVLQRYGVNTNEFFTTGVDVEIMEAIDNPLVRRAVENAKTEWDNTHGRK